MSSMNGPRALSGILLSMILLGTTGAGTQIQAQILDRLRKKAEEQLTDFSSIRRQLEGDRPLTTSLDDALTEVPFLDDFDPGVPAAMTRLPRNADGAFITPPGYFAYDARSYCLKAGTPGPRSGKGHVYAPLVGERAEMVRKVLRRSADFPEVSQREVQLLLWAIIARQDFRYMTREKQLAAGRLLDPEDIAALNGVSITGLQRDLVEKALAELPPSTRAVLQAEADLRDLYEDANATYEDFERVAVLATGAPDESGRDVPRGRWSFHPDGYFVRYLPDHYSRTRFEAYVPEPFSIRRDGEGRIVEIRDPTGDRLVVDYDDARSSAGGAESGAAAVGLRSVSLIRGSEGLPRASWADDGTAWSLVGRLQGAESDALRGSFPEAGDRVAMTRALERQTAEMLRSATGRRDTDAPPGDVVDLAHLKLALQRAGSPRKAGVQPVDFVTRAWQYSVCREAGGCETVVASAARAWAGENGTPVPHGPNAGEEWARSMAMPWFSGTAVDPTGGAAVPSSGQRLGVSTVPTDEALERMDEALNWAALTELLSLVTDAKHFVGLGMVAGMFIPNRIFGYIQAQTIGLWKYSAGALAGQGDPGDEGRGSPPSGGTAPGGAVDPGGSGSGRGGEGRTGRGTGGGADAGAAAGSGTGAGEDRGTGTGAGAGAGTGDSGNAGAGGGASTWTSGTPEYGGGSGSPRSNGRDHHIYPPSYSPTNPAPVEDDPDTPEELVAAANEYLESMHRLVFYLEAALDSKVRRDSAEEEGEGAWVCRQQAALTFYMQRAGESMAQVAGRLEHLLDLAEAAGAEDRIFSVDEVREIQERLAAVGWTDEERRTALALGVTDAELESIRRILVEADPEEVSGGIRTSALRWAQELRTQGAIWRALPDVVPPWDPGWTDPEGGCGVG